MKILSACRHTIAILLLTTSGLTAAASLTSGPDTAAASEDTLKKETIFSRILDYFGESNKPKKDKRFDVSFIGGPHFASDTKLGIGVVAAGTYYAKGDTAGVPSNVSLYGDVSMVGFYLLGVRGTDISVGDTRRIDYDVSLYSFPTRFWGIGYEVEKADSNETKYKLLSISASADIYFRVADGLYAGPGGEFVFNRASDVERLELWEGQPRNTRTLALGLSIKYDTRDNLTNPHRGTMILLRQRFAPRFLWNRMAFSYTQLQACWYTPVWRGATLATCLNGKFNYGNVPWGMMATAGGEACMRSYYEGRYRDKIAIEAVAEVRQHVWRRNSVVVWGGAGMVSSNLRELSVRKTLPCVGAGYRWEFKKDCNVRLDYGIGRGESAFTFSINEAF